MDIARLKVRQVMSAPVSTLSRSQSLPLAEELMKQRRVRHLPVVDDAGCLIGLVTHRDILRARVSSTASMSDSERSDLQLSTPVNWLMTTEMWTTEADTRALDAAQVLVDNKFGCLPVVDRDRRVVGIITEADFVALVLRLLPHFEPLALSDVMTPDPVTLTATQSISLADEIMSMEHIRHLPVVGDEGELLGLVTHRDLLAAQHAVLARTADPENSTDALDLSVRVAEIMTKEVRSVAPDTPLLEAAEALRDHRFGCLPVVDEGRVTGILTEADLLALLVHRLAAQVQPAASEAPVNYFMSHPVRLIGAEETLEEAQRSMQRYGVSSLGVAGDGGPLIGVITRTDLLAVAESRASMRRRLAPALVLPARPVSEVMTRNVVSVDADVPIGRAAAEILSRDVRRVFVVSDDTVQGVLSVNDFFRVARDLRISTPIAHHMTAMRISIDAAESLASAISLLDDADVSTLLVTDAGWTVGLFGQPEALACSDLPEGTPVERVMSHRVLGVPARMPMHLAGAQAAELGARALVAHYQGSETGVLTGTDFARACAEPPANPDES